MVMSTAGGVSTREYKTRALFLIFLILPFQGVDSLPFDFESRRETANPKCYIASLVITITARYSLTRAGGLAGRSAAYHIIPAVQTSPFLQLVPLPVGSFSLPHLLSLDYSEAFLTSQLDNHTLLSYGMPPPHHFSLLHLLCSIPASFRYRWSWSSLLVFPLFYFPPSSGSKI